MSTVPQMNALFQSNASDARYYRSSGRSVNCPCNTPEGFRDPELHLSFGRYGPISYETSPGNLPADSLIRYTLVAKNSAGTGMYPVVVYPTPFSPHITDTVNFQVALTFEWPPGGNFVDGAWEVWRQIANDPLTYCGDFPHPQDVFVDNGQYAPGSFSPPVMCNESGLIPSPVDIMVKAFCQPIQSTRATRLSTEYLQEVFGNIEADDHLGIFPVNWAGQRLEFHDWAQDGADFIEYNGERFFCINANMIPDPGDGNPEHHWELGLRMLRQDGLVS